MKKLFYFIFTFFYFLVCFVRSIGQRGKLDDLAFAKMLSELSDNNFVNANRKLVFFQLKKKKKRNYSTYMNYLYEFLMSTGVVSDMYSWNDNHFVAITNYEAIIDREAILDRFKGVIVDVAERLAKDVLPGLKGEL